MTRYLPLLLLICVPISACQTTTKQSVCDGFARLQPSLTTSVMILQTDRPFANQVAAHNRFGQSQKCWK